MNRYLSVLIAILFLSPVCVAKDVKLWVKNYEAPFTLELLRKALEVTEDEYPQATISPSDDITEGRAFASMKGGDGIDVMVVGINTTREAYIEPIYFPVDRGLLGIRLFLINPLKQIKFNKINTTQDIRDTDLTMGSGLYWPDTQILASNMVPLVTTTSYKNLFTMLVNDRFECFPRGLFEIENEISLYGDLNFTVESNIALVYPLANFMFVNASKPALKERIEKGLWRLKASGEFDSLFNDHFVSIMMEYGFYKRKLMFLENNTLSPRVKEVINQHGVISFVD